MRKEKTFKAKIDKKCKEIGFVIRGLFPSISIDISGCRTTYDPHPL
jgi:hypothetical protein